MKPKMRRERTRNVLHKVYEAQNEKRAHEKCPS
ncbi:hypothetical protein J2S19_002497 [Metabacillus malikii]|uniref:Uncharacterized protein n=1 Tax=Metabacillus malikii TaxID=1504265 RepID=A0ABT9ZG26_9BACI|nr:hypothetical protein [Metabacillus malikii]